MGLFNRLFNKHSKVSLALVMSALVLPLATGSVHAAQASLSLKVVEAATGLPVPGAAVCLGYVKGAGTIKAKMTDRNGRIDLGAVPRAQMHLTVGHAGMKTVNTRVRRLSYPFELTVKMGKGFSSGSCLSQASQASKASAEPMGVILSEGLFSRYQIPGVRVLDLTLSKLESDKNRLKIETNVEGNVTHFRVSDNSQFRHASWRPYQSSSEIEQVSRPQQVFFVQFKRAVEIERDDARGEISVWSEVYKAKLR